MKNKIGIISVVVILAILILAFAGYQIYRNPAMFRSLSDESLGDAEVESLRAEIAKREEKQVLVAYFSYSGTTRGVAEALSEATGGDLFEIAPAEAYTNVYLQSNSEIRSNARPALDSTVDHMEDYDIVFVGYPVWWHATPSPVNTFLESYDFTGKLVIPFCTSGGSDIEETMPTFLNSCQGIAVYGERRISSQGQIDGWLEELDLNLTNPGTSGSGTEPADTADATNGSAADATADPAAGAADTQAATDTADLATETAADDTADPAAGGNTLVAYFSWSGNTEEMASYIAEQVGGDLLEIQPETPYPTDYNECGDVALAERDSNARPAIMGLPDSIDQYDTILVGYPIWWHTAPMIIGTFLESYDLTGKEVYPFTQSASMDTEQFDNSIAFVRENAVGATVHDGLFAEPSDTETIDAYLTGNGLAQ
ncbi:MAG TPA: hypothetical protein IAA45_04355 [Candidatus Blautia gallistercoris]|uniref:Flavodoxin-like domain-containing protein n=2 Tax=Lachnospiraceae TaxID=186803 RepID=A0A9D1WGU9_9FIRM|nr:hypothetical protein [Candidatus Blautia gallistercoris]